MKNSVIRSTGQCRLYVAHCALYILIPVLFLANIFFGSVHIDFSEVWAALWGKQADAAVSFIVVQSRLPEAITALFTGAALAVSGLMLQTAFHNPLAGPAVLGISGGASFGVAIVTLVGGLSISSSPHILISSLAALIGALAVTALLLFLSTIVRNNLILLITGLLLGYLLSALVTIMTAIATPESLQSYVVWGMAQFSSIDLGRLPAYCAVLLLLLFLSLLLIKPLNALQLGEEYAQNLGISLRLTRNLLLLLVGGITAMTTACCGPVAFIGLAVPHMARMLYPTDNYRQLMPLTLLCGSAVALFCNLLCTLPPQTVLPLNAVTPLVGIPVIVYVLLASRKK